MIPAISGCFAGAVNSKTSPKEGDITLAGLIDVPVYLDVEKDTITETIGVEFNLKGGISFFHFPLNEIQNKIYSLDDILGKAGRLLIEQINNTGTIQ